MGVSRVRLAEVDGTTGALGALNVSVNNTVNDIELDEAEQHRLPRRHLRHGRRAWPATGSPGSPSAGAGAVTALSVPTISGNVSALALDGAGGLFVGGAFQITPEKDNPAVLARVTIATNAVDDGRALLRDPAFAGPDAADRAPAVS